MSVFIRRFTSDPGNAVLTNIEAVDILDLDPPASISGVGSGTVCMVGEFENGPFDVATEISGAQDLLATFGGFGFASSAGLPAQNPCARKRNADTAGATAWNGNGYVHLAGKRFSRLVIMRVDTSVGTVAITNTATMTADYTIPAGTVVSDGTHSWVTMQDLFFANGAASAAQSVKIRPATDDGTAVTALAAAVNQITLPAGAPAFTVTNALAIAAALSESAVDAAYTTAISATEDINSVCHDINIIVSARQSSAIRAALKANAIDASGNGLLGRMACVRPPQNTTRTAAKGTGDPGVGANRDQRVIYCYPGVQLMMPSIAAIGTAGGYGFTATGVINAGSDALMASVLSQLPPEENPGQLTTYTAGVIGIEANTNTTGFAMADYIAFRGAGIAAPRVDGGTVVFQSGVTSVDPTIYPNLRNIARRRMADFVQDTLSARLKAFGKKLNTFARRKAIASEIRTFMNGLLSANNPGSQRIGGYVLDEKSGNTPASLALGIFRLILKVQTLSSMDAIVLQTTIGESVDVSEAA